MRTFGNAIKYGILVIGAMTSIARADALLQPIEPLRPTEVVEEREVYGNVEYNLELLPDPNEARKTFSTFLRSVVGSTFGQNDEGSFVVTIVAFAGATELAQKAIFSFSWKNKTFLFFTQKSDISNFTSFSGSLLDHFPISNFNNNLEIQLQLRRSTTVALDTDTYNQFSQQVAKLNFPLLHNAVVLSEALRQPLAILATVLDTYEKRDLTSEIAMSFTKEDDSPNPNSISFKLVGPTPVHNFVKVTIKLGTDPSIVTNRFDTAHNKFPEDLDLKAIYNAAKVGTTSSFLPLRDAFSKEKQKDLLDYLNDMDKEKFPEGKTVKQVCQKLFDAAEDFFSVRDAPAVYASFLDRYEAVLALQSSAKTDCIDEFSTSFNKYGVPLSQIQFNH